LRQRLKRILQLTNLLLSVRRENTADLVQPQRKIVQTRLLLQWRVPRTTRKVGPEILALLRQAVNNLFRLIPPTTDSIQRSIGTLGQFNKSSPNAQSGQPQKSCTQNTHSNRSCACSPC